MGLSIALAIINLIGYISLGILNVHIFIYHYSTFYSLTSPLNSETVIDSLELERA